jgi:non-ribosomal peptide synthase protein (TIGR01720 family)
MYPVSLDLANQDLSNLDGCLKSVKEQLRKIPQRGVGFSLIKYLSGVQFRDLRDQIAARSEAMEQVYFNFLGKFDSLFKTPELNVPNSSDPLLTATSEGAGTTVTALIEMNAIIGADNCLECEWKFVTNLFEDSEIEDLSSRFLRALSTLASFVDSGAEVGGFTPSDFPLVPSLTQESLDKLAGTGKAVEDLYPLTPLQEGMLFHTLKDPHDELYITQIAWSVTVPSVDLFKRAWTKIIERHPILRSSFAWDGFERPLQVVHKPYPIDSVWTDLDFSAMSPEEVQEKITEYLTSDRVKGFDLSQPHLLRLTLVTTPATSTSDVYTFIFTHHHLYLDGWSVANVLSELQALYDSGCECELLEVSPFKDYVKVLQGRDAEKAKQFWTNELRAYEAPLQLPRPVYRLSTEKANTNLNKEAFLSKEVVERMGSFLKVHQLTLNTLVQAVWGLILNSLTREKFVVFGSTYSGRSFVDGSLPSIGNMVGMFINTLPIGLHVDTKQVVLEFLRQVQLRSVMVNEFEDSSLLLVKSCSSIDPAASLFNSIVVVENYPASKYETSTETSGKKLNIDETTRFEFERTNFPLTWAVSIHGDCGCGPEGVSIKAMYDGTQLDPCVVDQMLGLWAQLIEQVVVHGGEEKFLIRDLELVSTQQREAVEQFNTDVEAEFDSGDCLHLKFERQVELRPDTIALFDDDEQLTYRELNKRANQLARFMQSIGVGMEAIVAIDMKRCVELFLCMLASLKLGAGYLAMEPTFPEERKRYLLANSDACIVFVQGSSIHERGVNISAVDFSAFDGSNLEVPVHPLNSAYYIYTSGSTGQPKGVQIPHGSAVKAVDSWENLWNFGDSIRWLQRTTLVFDFCIPEIYAPLIYGGAIVSLPSEDEKV